jgi:hypothetical protein
MGDQKGGGFGGNRPQVCVRNMSPAASPESVRQVSLRAKQLGYHHGNAHRERQSSTRRVTGQDILHFVAEAKHFFGAGKDHPAGIGQCQIAAALLKQLCINLFLELAKRATDGLRSQVQNLRGARGAAVGRDRP